MIPSKLIQFCPDTGGPCAGPSCAAFQSGMALAVQDGGPFVKRICGDIPLIAPLPIVFSLDLGVCSKYEGIVDEESFELFKRFTEDFEGNIKATIGEVADASSE